MKSIEACFRGVIMIFQWYLFVLMIGVSGVAHITGQVVYVKIYGKYEKRYSWFPVLVLIIPMIYLAATRIKLNFGDTSAYVKWFGEFPNSILGLPLYLTNVQKDKGFAVFSTVIKSIIGNNVEVYFAVIATICLLAVAYGYKKMSCSFIFSMFLFVASGEYIQWGYNGIRQFIPVALLFAASELVVKKRYTEFILLILLLSTIHASALLMLPMIFIVQGKAWNNRTVLFAISAMVAIVCLDHFTGLITTIMENTQYSNEVNQYLTTEGTNILRVIVFAIPPVMSLIFRKYIEYANNPIVNLSVNMSIISLGIYIVSVFTSGIFIGRIPIYFSLYNYILIPWLVENCFEKRSARIIYIFIISAYLIFYYYQVSITWGL